MKATTTALLSACAMALMVGTASGAGSLPVFPGGSGSGSGSGSGTTDTGSSYQAGYDAGVSSAIATCQADPLSCDIFDSVRYWEAYYLGVDVAIDVCQSDPGSCGIEGAPWFNQGYQAGTQAMMASCNTDPGGCGVTLSSVLPPAAFGETEPNDNLIAADPLVLDSPFWGQSYGNDDTDFFYFETADENQTLVINFQVPGTGPEGWLLRVRDAAGNVYATVDTADAATTIGADNDITYMATLGLAGTYYVEVDSNTVPVSSNPYTLTAMLQDSPLDTGNFKIGFYDAEVEFNDQPSQANPLATSVTMYGLVNLTFDNTVPQDNEFVWAQGEEDWYKYTTAGNEIVTLSFCAKEECGPGNWLVEVYDAAGADQLEAGVSEQEVDPILAYNTDILEGSPQQPEAIRFGLMQAGTYYMRVNHKRLYTAPCAGYKSDWDNDGVPSGPPGAEDQPQACGCESGYSCSFDVLNPVDVQVPVSTDWPRCPGSGDRTEECEVTCVCAGSGEDGAPSSGCATTGLNPQSCECPFGLPTCELLISNPGAPVDVTETQYDICPDGSGGGINPQCEIGCLCTAFSGVVEVPEGAVTGQYNFTWYGTKLPPFTSDTDAYDEFENRPSPL